jgi:hypothetical protein
MAPIVTKRPEMLIGVKRSPNTRPAAEMVTTSLKIPAMERVTTEVRFSRANSEAVIQNAIAPGNSKIAGPKKGPFAAIKTWRPRHNAGKPSTGMAIRNRDRNMMGARKKIEEKGLDVAGLRRRRICVRAQRKPEKKAAEMTRVKPRMENFTSPATIIITPAVMVAMMAIRRMEGVSRRKQKAKRRTKAREEDLHIAGYD